VEVKEASTAPDVRIVFIAGYARCGSTLLERLLGQLEGFESFGELRHVWFRSFEDNELCGCGVPFHECPFWTEVVDRAFGGFDCVDAAAISRNKRRIDSPVNIPRIVTGGWPASYRRRTATYTEQLRALYVAMRDVSGARYLVDASKDPQHAYILRTIPGFDVRVVHLIRDSRAVAFSWRRVRERPEIHWEARDMPRYPVVRTAFAWSLTNVGSGLASRLGIPYTRLRYEDLVRDPAASLTWVLDRLDLGRRPLDFLRDQGALLRPAHTVSGNPMRFQTGEVPIRPDEEWMEGMQPSDRRWVTTLPLPLLHRYGYPAHPGEDVNGTPPRPEGTDPARSAAGPSPGEMWRTLRLAFAHRQEPAAYGRAVSGLLVRYLRSRGIDPRGKRWLEVGTGSGALPEALASAGASVVGLDLSDRRAPQVLDTPFVIGAGQRLPFAEGSFDAVSCSNVLEHVPDPSGLVTELLRVCRPGGIVYLSWTNWLSPFGGHEWSPWHYAGSRLGPRIYTAITGHAPRNVPGRTLFPVHVGRVLGELRRAPVAILDIAPRYWPSLRFLGRIPIVREFLMWNCAVVVRKR